MVERTLTELAFVSARGDAVSNHKEAVALEIDRLRGSVKSQAMRRAG